MLHLSSGPVIVHSSRLMAASVLTMLSLFVPSAQAQAGPSGPTPFDLAQYRGRVVVVDFWASWCAPCRRSIPWLNEMYSRYGEQGLVIVGINVDRNRGDAERFLREVPIDFEVVYDSDGELAERYQVEAMPSTYIFDRNGELAERHLGFLNRKRSEYEALLGRLLQ